ncbi:TATA box-binding protein-associated factor RNA polymerase I subunit B [Latimeria chalumnae]|uniref:TATA box-binding protein-associated factor RNA polymerase I subunit B n=1 Tax=Latimeria chalumnae TaxID=7897 RepID=H3AEV7_LATCH|nr:PREDICTED: TATA box-binding protein-associated factor RNA polymerase I subunit B [Latimeria chalumnae]|eukprot:XP_005998737.1 PREDICTED: TATA box-binding protein-associated factor RNA polymerase I subunit B [Latimeria chalumnae]
MDEEETRDYKDPCLQCSDINWGISDEGKFYCKSCHNVIEKTKECAESEVFMHYAKAFSISRGLKNKRKLDKSCEWYVCEGFQFILKQQAESLLSLGVCSQIKDEIICNFWRRYLQKSRQAYTSKQLPQYARPESNSECSTEWESEPESLNLSNWSLASESEPVTCHSDSSLAQESSCGKTSTLETASICSGSIDGREHMSANRRGKLVMTMPMTLAFCYMALLWLREPLTLADLLRLVAEDHIPYINTYQFFPEEVKLFGVDLRIFKVQSVPSYEKIQETMRRLALFLDLPQFPQVTETCFLHPDMLCIKYLMEANLPDEVHNWTCKVVKKTGVGESAFLTFDPLQKQRTNGYELQAAAVIVVTLKLLFLLDDKYEWMMSNLAEELNEDAVDMKYFEFRKWCKTMKSCLNEAEKKVEEDATRHLWVCDKLLYSTSKEKPLVNKNRRMLASLQRQFDKLLGSLQDGEKQSPSSFQFNWSEESTEKTCYHKHSLDGILKEKGKFTAPCNTHYWLSSLRICKGNYCRHPITKSEEANFPRSYLFVLNLFSFLLGVEVSTVHEEVCQVEHKLFPAKKSKILSKKYKRV